MSVFLVSLAMVATAWPAMAVDFESSRTLSLAGVGRGGAMLGDTIYLNASLLGFQPVVSLAGTYFWHKDSTQPADGSSIKTYNVSVIDGKNQYVNAGLAYTRKAETDFLHLSLAKRALSWLSFGTTLKRFTVRGDGLASGIAAGETGVEAGLSTSVLFREPLFGTPLQLGLVGENLIGKASTESVFGPRQIGLGLKLNLASILLIYFDVVDHLPSESSGYRMYSGAGELDLGGGFFVRGGMFGSHEKGFSAGLGWIGPRIGVSYGYQNKKLASSVRDFQHAVTMDMYL